jgi:hypothetical protein
MRLDGIDGSLLHGICGVAFGGWDSKVVGGSAGSG